MPLDRDGPRDLPFEPPPPALPERPIFEWFDARARRDPTAAALIDRAVRLSYGELRARTLNLAHRITVSVPRARAVGIWLRADTQLPLAILACLAAGRTALVLNHRNPPGRIASIIEEARPAAIIHADSGPYRDCIPDGIQSIALESAEQCCDAPVWDPRSAAGPDDPAVVLYTSGSTGQAKGIVLSQRALLCRVGQVIAAWHMYPGDRFLSLSTPPTIPGLTGCVAALLAGTGQILGDLLEDGMGRMLALAQRERVTILVGLPSLLGGFAEVSNATQLLAGLRIVRTTGDALLRDDLRVWRTLLPPHCHVMTTFGSTEMVTFAQWFVPPSFDEEEARLPVGYPLPDHEFTVMDERGRAAAVGEIGELVLRSRNIALGEWVGGRWIPGRLITDSDDPSKRILFTGDLVRQRPDGLITFVGRRDAQVKVRGQRVELAEIESALCAMAGVRDAAVAAARDGEEVVLHAFVVTDDTAQEEQRALPAPWRTNLAKVLPDYMVPSTLTLVENLPRLASGKIDRGALLGGEGGSIAR